MAIQNLFNIAPILFAGPQPVTETTVGNTRAVTFVQSNTFSTNQTFVDTNQVHRGIYIVHDITAIGATTLTLGVDFQDPASLKWINLFTATGVTTNATRTYAIHPNAPAAGAGITAVSTFELPRTYRVFVNTSTAVNSTWSLGGLLLI